VGRSRVQILEISCMKATNLDFRFILIIAPYSL
jgi:hypothetical protein